jgi:pyridoxine 5-phosphate synthase
VSRLKKVGIFCSIFLDPDIDQIEKALQIGADAIEIHTGKFCNMQNYDDALNELNNIKKSAKYAKSIGLEVHAGHGLTFNNVFEIANIKEINELNIGHFIIGESISIGIKDTIKKMQNIIDQARVLHTE